LATENDGFGSQQLVFGLPIREPNSHTGQTVALSPAASSYLNTNVGQNVVELLRRVEKHNDFNGLNRTLAERVRFELTVPLQVR
jgi:hypothetical protein